MPSELPHVLVLVPGFPRDESDLACIPAVQNFVESLGDRLPKDSLQVVSFQYPVLRQTYRWRGIRVHSLGGDNSRIAKAQTWLRALRTGRRIMHRRQNGVIHSFWIGECALAGSLLAYRSDWRHIVSIGGQEVRSPTIYSWLLRHASFTLTAGSRHAAEHASRHLGRDVDAIIPLGLDIDRVQGHRTNGEIDVLAVGSLVPVKRVDHVVDVAARIVKHRPHLSVQIVGSGPEGEKLQRRVAAEGLESTVQLRGELPRAEVLHLMRRSRVLLHPSEYESQGYVFLEALASGMHVVCREVGFLPDTPRVAICNGVEEMTAAVERILAGNTADDDISVPTAAQSVQAFLELYTSE